MIIEIEINYNPGNEHKYKLKIELSHHGHILAILLEVTSKNHLELFGRQEQETVDLGAIDALALQPTQNPDPWRFTVAVEISDVSAMREFSSALKSRMPLMQSAGRLGLGWKLRGKDWARVFDVWDDEAASKQENGGESANEENSGKSYGEENSGQADDVGSSGQANDKESSSQTDDEGSSGKSNDAKRGDKDRTSEEEMDNDHDESVP